MKVTTTPINGLLLIEPQCFQDERGFFLETYRMNKYKDSGIPEIFVQGNQSRSKKGVLRGMHFQVKRPQAQIVTVMRGHVFDVGVDLRPESPTFGQWYGTKLSDEKQRQFYMAPGIAHGFCVLSDWADLHYQVSRYYDHEDEGGLRWNDPEVKIQWPIDNPSVTSRDANYPLLSYLSRSQLPHDPPVEIVK